MVPLGLKPRLCANESEQVSAKQGGFTQTHLRQGLGRRGPESPALPGTGTDREALEWRPLQMRNLRWVVTMLTQEMAALRVHRWSAELLKGPSKGGVSFTSVATSRCFLPSEDPRRGGPQRDVSERVENVALKSLGCARMPSRAPMTETPWPSVLLSSPFDTEIFLVSPSPTVKFSVGSRKGSLYNWTPPSTPSFRERYYLVSGPGTLWSCWDGGRGGE